MTTLIDFGHSPKTQTNNIEGLQAHLTQLVGEPFQFVRVSYGDELTLHFGTLKPAKSPKLKGKMYGTYVLGVRGSSWILKSGSKPVVLSSGLDLDNIPNEFGKPISKETLEANPPIQIGTRVLSATPFVVKPVNAFGLEIRVSDGSAILIFPTLPDAEEPEEEGLPEIADWELNSPNGLLSAGPSLVWTFTPISN